MRAHALLITLALAATPALASTLKLDDGTKVSVEIAKGSQAEVFVLINGLIYATNRWDQVANRLSENGATVIRFALPGQPENLRLLKKGEEPNYFSRGLELTDIAENLRLILKAANITTKIHLVGLSYGASVAAEFTKTHSDLVEDVTFVSPLVVPTDEYDTSGKATKDWLNAVRFWENSSCALYGAFNPYPCIGQDYWYDSFYKSIYESYLEGRIEKIPAGVDEVTYKKAVFHLVRATRDFDLKEEIKSLHNVSMLVADLDEAHLAVDQKLAWKNVSKADKLEFKIFKNTHHALPDEAPEELSAELLKIAMTKH